MRRSWSSILISWARACVDLAKDWRTDRYLRRLEAMLLVADKSSIFTVTGVGDVLEPEYGVAAVGSGGNYALSAARALIEETDLDAEQVARKAMKIAAEICVYTNRQSDRGNAPGLIRQAGQITSAIRPSAWPPGPRYTSWRGRVSAPPPS